VEIASSRPLVSQKLMGGRTPAEAARVARRLFSLCAQAQEVACRSACEVASGLEIDRDESERRARAVIAERAREHGWRLLLDWPQHAGHAPDVDALSALRRMPAENSASAMNALLQEVLGESPADWLQRDLVAFDAWRMGGRTPVARLFGSLEDGPDPGACSIGLLPCLVEIDQEQIGRLSAAALGIQGFCASPVWDGQPVETGVVARMRNRPLLAQWLEQRGRGIGARLLARLLDLAETPSRLVHPAATTVGAWLLDRGGCVAGVETSRGLLLHFVRMAGECIGEYRIVAPTEWNFHRDGPLARGLTALPDDAQLATRARQLTMAVDPCVAFGLEIVDA
jgi:hypothetical protein